MIPFNLQIAAFRAIARIQLNGAQVEALMKCADAHYDGTCRLEARFLGNHLAAYDVEDPEFGFFSVDTRKLDLWMKILEVNPELSTTAHSLREDFFACFKFLNASAEAALLYHNTR